MSEMLTLSAESRAKIGKGASRALRNSNRVPAVIYGNNEAPEAIHIEEKFLVKALMTGHFFNSVVMIELNGKQIRTLPKDVAFHPVKDRPLHADFMRISEHTKVHVSVPIRYVEEALSPGLKRGGVLNHVRHELELVCDAANIPDDVVISLKGYELNTSIHISMVELPAGAASAITDRDFTIATILAPSGLKSAEAGE